MTSPTKKVNPQWNRQRFLPPSQDPAILAYQPSPGAKSPRVSHQSNNSFVSNDRETGNIEKLLHSYGFIQCCDQDARLFFHFSEYSGNIETAKIGDYVEFQMSRDNRTGRPIAICVNKSEDNTSSELLSESRVQGSIVAEAKSTKNRNGMSPGLSDGFGRVSYESMGECFFLPFSADDYEGDSSKLRLGDQVTFYIATDKRSGNIRSCKLQSVQAVTSTDKYQGVVCSMKENFGFIERSDVVKEIFFHYSEFCGEINELILGDDVEFSVQTRNNKEVAVGIKRLQEGTVIFEDLGVDQIQGQVIRTLKTVHGRRQSDPLAGRIKYESANGPQEIPYGDKDQRGDYSLHPGDVVVFHIATDRRDKLQRATNIELLEDSFTNTGENREQGVVAALKEGYGFIRCTDREARMFFHFSEMLDVSREVKVQDEVEFTIIQDPTSVSRQIAIRIKYLPRGSIQLESVSESKYSGVIDKEPASHKSPTKNKDEIAGTIAANVDGKSTLVPYYARDLIRSADPKFGDKVEFQFCESKRNNVRYAVNIRVVSRTSAPKQQGFIATLKDNYGFIEASDLEKELFFHYSAFEGDAGELDLGDEVEYTLTKKSSKLSAENIRKAARGAVCPLDIQPTVLSGSVQRPMRIVNPEQEEYCGIVQVGGEGDSKTTCYPYGIASLADKRDFLQKGDAVRFQIAKVKLTGKVRATNVAAIRKYNRAKVDSVKGQFGFIHFEAEEGKKLFFHLSEVHDGAAIQPGDEVEFVVVQNQRNGKYSACSLRKITESRRPDHLLSRLKSISEQSDMPKVVLIRQPKGPDGTIGFKLPRTASIPVA